MSIAAKHMDPIVGVDIHIILIPTPAGPVPTPLPNPFVGMVLDPFDYIPFIGATVYINGMPRGQAGTGGVAMPPHLPLGGPFGPPPPGNEAEIFMGSSTVASDGDAQSFLGMPALTCQSIGMPAPPRMKGQPAKSLVLPTSVVLSIPMGMLVLIGGPPTISLMALGMRAIMALAGPLAALLRRAQRGTGRIGRAMRAATARARRAGNSLADFLRLGPRARSRVNRAICFVTGHPVDIATGKVFTDKVDLELAGPMPFKWERVWYSTSTYDGPIGHGWHHSYDAGLYVTDEVVLYRTPDGRLVDFPALKEGQEHFDRTERLTLIRTPGKYDGEYTVRTIERVTYRFRELRKSARDHQPRSRDDRFDPREHVLTGIHDGSGQGITFGYDESGRLTDIIDSCGRLLQLGYDRHGRIAALTAPHPDEEDQRFVVMQYAYDSAGNLVQTIDALGQPATYGYDRHLLSKETDRNGLSFYFKYDRHDEHAKCLRTWGDGGIYDHKLSYDSDTNLTIVENSLGYRTEYFHDGSLVTKILDPRGGVTEIEYNEHYQRIQEKDPAGGVSTWAYDDRGNTTEDVGTDGGKVDISYAGDSPVELVDTVGGVWKWTYDARGRVVEQTDPLGATTRFVHQGNQLGAIIDPLANTTGLGYTPNGLLAAVHAADGGSSAWEYDRMGRPVSARDPNGNLQRRRFDLLGRVLRVDEPDGNVRELGHDGEGNVTRSKDVHHDVRFVYQGVGRLSARHEAGTVVRFEYDTEEQITALSNEHGHIYQFELGPGGDVLLERGWDGVRRIYWRDVAGRTQRLTRARGIESRYTYDKGGRVARIEHVRPAAAIAGASDAQTPADAPVQRIGFEQFVYRADGALVEAKNDSGTVKLKRDVLGRILRDEQGKHWVASEYDARGFRTAMSSSMKAKLDIERNAMGDVTALSSEAGFATRIERDLLGLELGRDLPGGAQSRWQRDKLGRPIQHEIHTRNGVIRARSYHWERNDRLKLVVDALRGPTRYDHDAFANLAVATTAPGTREVRMPDAVGNLFKRDDRRDRTYGPAGQLLESIDARGRITRYVYDHEGNLIEKREGEHRTWKYTWDGTGMLSEVQRPDGTMVRFEYDALGRRVAKHHRGLTTRWVWDGVVPLHEWVEGKLERLEAEPAHLLSIDADVKRRENELSDHLTRGPPQRGSLEQPITWLFEPDTFDPIAKLSAEGMRSIVADHLGAPVAMLDSAGSPVWTADLDTYGEPQQHSGARADCPFRWPGQYEDAETGLYYNRFRYYDPEGGVYVSQDPIGLDGGLALYAYALDPLAFTDPLGLNSGAGRDHVTYRGTKNGMPYTGYASAPSNLGLTPNEIVARRYGGDFASEGLDSAPDVVYSGSGRSGKATARGLEQHHYEADVRQHGRANVANRQRPVGPRNARRAEYRRAANRHVGCK
jgi:RHS repeat-associated protein